VHLFLLINLVIVSSVSHGTPTVFNEPAPCFKIREFASQQTRTADPWFGAISSLHLNLNQIKE
jgi:hypothetical protein